MVIDEEVSRKVDTIRDNLYTVMKKMTMAQKSACRKNNKPYEIWFEMSA